MGSPKGKEDFFIDTVVFTIITYNEIMSFTEDKKKKIKKWLHTKCWNEEFVRIEITEGYELNKDNEDSIFRKISLNLLKRSFI